jgi:hypothetical protein
LRGEEEPVDAMTEAALLDVIVLSRGCEFAGQLAVDGKAPILVVGDDKPLSVPVNCVAVAWDGSHEAAVALRGGLPLLKMAGQVHVLTVGDKAGVFPPLDAVQYLSRHGVKAEIDRWRGLVRLRKRWPARWRVWGGSVGDGRLWSQPVAGIPAGRGDALFPRSERRAESAFRPLILMGYGG